MQFFFFWSGNISLLPKLLAIEPAETLPWPKSTSFFRRPVLHAEVHWQYLKPVLPVKFSHRQSTDPFSNCVSQGFFCLELFKVPEQISRHWENQPWYSLRKKSNMLDREQQSLHLRKDGVFQAESPFSIAYNFAKLKSARKFPRLSVCLRLFVRVFAVCKFQITRFNHFL